ncbi:MAG: alpha/beta-hydrolase family protein [Planctomycetes bacterium]|nr:alpha/beta-hydrolase family protein [Planctomycetota bacterium]
MFSLSLRLQTLLGRFWASFSYVGLAVGTLFFAASLTPSLLPRHFAVQGILSGFALAVGYGLGVFFVWLWLYLEIPEPNAKTQRVSKQITTVAVAIVVALFLWRASIWQNSIRQLMEMEPVATAYPWRVALIALLTGVLLIATARCLSYLWRYVHRKINLVVPRRVSYVVSTLVVVVGVFLIADNVIARLALNAADALFLRLDQVVDDGVEQPTAATASGSAESLIAWDTIGRQGKMFVATGPTRQAISQFWGKEAVQPLRVYVGLGTKETTHQRATLARQELQRVGGFDRSVLVVATPTGTGWLDPGGVDTFEYLHAGDTAIVSMQYSYLPSWLTILVDPTRSRDSAKDLFDEIYDHWTTLPKNSRPKLYVHGLSLGALGSAASADLFTVFEDPIQGGVWSGPPFASTVWTRATRYRNPDSPMWLPKSRDGSMLRFTGQENTLDQSGKRWGPMRFVFIQHASDPMTFFAPELLYRKPDWLVGQRGPDVSPYLSWLPIVTLLQAGFDLPMATTVPAGYGHNFAPSSYIDAWVEVSQPEAWSADDTRRLKQLFVK